MSENGIHRVQQDATSNICASYFDVQLISNGEFATTTFSQFRFDSDLTQTVTSIYAAQVYVMYHIANKIHYNILQP